MHPVTIVASNTAVLFPRHKKYNASVNYTDLTVYFRLHKKLIKRTTTVVTKKRIIVDYKELLELFDKQEWTKEEQEKEKDWALCHFKTVNSFNKYKKPIIRFLYDDPEAEEIHQDLYLLADTNEYGYKPYLTEVVMPDADLSIEVLKNATKLYLKECFNVKVKKSHIKFIKQFEGDKLEKEWKDYKKNKDQDKLDEKSGKKHRIVFLAEAAKELFGDDVKSVVIEGNKTTITLESGEIFVDVRPNLKFVKKKKQYKKSQITSNDNTKY